jgi:FtsZ-binding cell division protein ZapB
MNILDEDIEKLLRSAPQPPPPAKLKEKLVEQVELLPARRTLSRPAVGQPWLRRWWPALAPGAVSLACAAVIAMQQSEITTLRSTNESLAKSAANVQTAPTQQAIPVVFQPANTPDGPQAEIARLRELVERLKSEVAQLEQAQAQNQQLRAELARPQANTPAQDEAAARDRAMRIECVNQMKQLGLAAKMWALDNSNLYPEQVIFITNYIGGFSKLLVCPADTGRQPAPDWASWSPANLSYDYLAPGAECDKDPNRVLFRCPIHGNVALCDGSVQSQVAKDHPERFVERDGKLFYQSAPQTATPPAVSPGQ